MMGSTDTVSMVGLKELVESIDGVNNMHHVHLWRPDEHDIFLEAHIDVRDMRVSETTTILNKLEDEFREHFAVTHTTIQFECDHCDSHMMV